MVDTGGLLKDEFESYIITLGEFMWFVVVDCIGEFEAIVCDIGI